MFIIRIEIQRHSETHMHTLLLVVLVHVATSHYYYT